MYDKKRSNTNQLHQDADGAGTTAAHGQGGQIGARAFREIFIDADACGDVLGLARLQNIVVGVVFELDVASEAGRADAEDVVTAAATFAQSPRTFPEREARKK